MTQKLIGSLLARIVAVKVQGLIDEAHIEAAHPRFGNGIALEAIIDAEKQLAAYKAGLNKQLPEGDVWEAALSDAENDPDYQAYQRFKFKYLEGGNG